MSNKTNSENMHFYSTTVVDWWLICKQNMVSPMQCLTKNISNSKYVVAMFFPFSEKQKKKTFTVMRGGREKEMLEADLQEYQSKAH